MYLSPSFWDMCVGTCEWPLCVKVSAHAYVGGLDSGYCGKWCIQLYADGRPAAWSQCIWREHLGRGHTCNQLDWSDPIACVLLL